jgi:hypothetical protein
MSDPEVRKIIDKVRKLRALSDARERVRQLERELYGAPARPLDPSQLPEFLSQHHSLRVVRDERVRQACLRATTPAAACS